MDGLYTAAALAMRYWFLVAAAVVLLGVTGISINEYREKRYVLSVAQRSIGYLHVISGPEDILGCNMQLMNENTIGRARNLNIVLHDPSVAKAHAQVFCSDGGVYVRALSRGEITVNGASVDGVSGVFDADVICFGNVVTRLFLKEDEWDGA